MEIRKVKLSGTPEEIDRLMIMRVMNLAQRLRENGNSSETAATSSDAAAAPQIQPFEIS